MSENQDPRAERVARYKEERRRQLVAQFSNLESSPARTGNKDAGGSGNGSEGPRATRASKLRLAALSQENGSSPQHANKVEKTPPSPSPQSVGEPRTPGSRRIDRDKSNKRKSNLNRSLTSEEVPPADFGDDTKNRRRRRRFFPPEVLDQSLNTTFVVEKINDAKPTMSQSPSSPITATSPTIRLTPRKSELSMHMENARRGVAPSFSELGKYKPFAKRAVTSSPKSSPSKNFETSPRVSSRDSKISVPDESKTITNRMEELSNLTKQTLARVERLANRNKESPSKQSARNSPLRDQKITSKVSRKSPSIERLLPSSILKRKTDESPAVHVESVVFVPSAAPGPVSILKRKVSQDDHNRSEGAHSSNNTPPVTFSPSVVEPSTSRRKQGILKKRRSLDESTVLRHRSCSPDVANKSDSRSILKSQRRSSLEELRRTQSPEIHLHGILKRKTSRNEDDDQSLNSPQSILKRRSGASSAGSTSSTPHVSITTAVILAAAGGAEMVLDPDNEHVKPILKKKSFSEDHSYHSDVSCDTPKPILKKKSSTETDESDDKPKPILKLPKLSLERETLDTGQESRSLKVSESECEYKPILKQGTSKDESPRPRLSFCGERNTESPEVRLRTSRRSNTICTDFNVASTSGHAKDEDRQLRKPRPLSVSELVMTFEKTCSTTVTPKRTSLTRNSDRYKTQPVTSGELEASLNFVQSSNPLNETHQVNYCNFSTSSRSLDGHSLLDFTTSLEHDNNLNSFLSSSLHNSASPESLACGKMSSDSAFQSLGDGLELEQDGEVNEVSTKDNLKLKGKLEPSKLEIQMKAIAEEAKKMRLGKGNTGIERYRSKKSVSGDRTPSRFSTQPVTFEEVQEASRINTSADETTGDGAGKSPDRRSILKTPESNVTPRPPLSPTTLRSALKKRLVSPTRKLPTINVGSISPDRDDEGISCNDSASDSDSSAKEEAGCSSGKTAGRYVRGNGDSTSEGESSGGREIRSIFKNENQLKLKQTLENVLSKSRSHGMLGDVQPFPVGGGVTKKTVTVRRSQTQHEMPQSIADLRAKLQERGESEWKKRVPLSNNATDELKLLKEKNRYNDELSEKTLLAARKDELDASSKQWKARVEKSDAEKFSVAGKMGEKIRDAVPTINIPACDDNKKRTPQAKRFKLRDGADSTPTTPEKNSIFDLTRSKSVPYSPMNYDISDTNGESKPTARTVSVFKPDDVTFDTFFKSLEHSNSNSDKVELSLDDFDAVERQSLLVIKKNVQVPKRRGASRNPIKALASRSDITNEYTEVITGVAEREKKRLNIEKLAKNSNKALEALAGLASNEDFKSVALKKSSVQSVLYPWKDLMLLHVKGRRLVQTRLVEPVASSINEGDSYILITPKALYTYNGKYSNVIEQSRAADVVNHIQKTGDMGCRVDKVITINGQDTSSRHVAEFWRLLGSKEPPETVDAGHPEEDETYESNILHTNMIYTLEEDELIPNEKYWGSIPKIEMLNETAIHVFDFGSEMYIWSGKTAPIAKKKMAMKLAKDIWDDGYNYSDCNICPLNAASILGAREQLSLPKQDNKRPDWALFAKITQHRETVLFREKFLDWPDFSRVIRVKSNDSIKEINASYDIKPCSVDEMLQEQDKHPDLVIDGTHLGRGDKYFEEETRRHFEYETLDIKGWRILENTHDELKGTSIGQFYDGDSYIYSWSFRQTVRGRELNGNPSKRAPVGRDRCIFFCWQGSNSSINEKGTAAFLTVELDKQNAPQVRVVQGSEPAAFLNLFEGGMVIYKGKRDEVERSEKPRLFIVRGEVEREVYLMEVPLVKSSLRSRSSLVLVDIETEQITLWHGAKSSKHKRKITKATVQKLLKNKPHEMYLDDYVEDLDIVEMDEGKETDDFLNILGYDRNTYHSLLGSDLAYDFTMRLFSLSSITGFFTASEVLCLHRSEYVTPYPFVQNELYSASQPGLFLIDNDHELWLWQGWWPETEDEMEDLSDQTGSGAMRFHAERRAAMQTAVNYWRKKHGDDVPVKAFLVWAGMEPLVFKCLFPTWEDRDDVKELNAKEGRIVGDVIPLEQELALLSRTTYPLAELLQRPLPDGVDPTHIEKYLSPEDFQVLLSMTKEEFDKLPSWKQTALKKEKGLF